MWSPQGGVDKKRLHFIEGGQAGNREVRLFAMFAANILLLCEHMCVFKHVIQACDLNLAVI